ncbi:MAG: hypothetical protein ISF22_09735 [Methanomassiliicoccus sp.]|nr:hypothetical protein [Methanomassiliicoccus sp.]
MNRFGEVLRGERSTILFAATLLSLVLSSIALSAFLLRSGVANAGDLTWPYFNEPGLTGLYIHNSQAGIIPNQMIIYSWLFYLPVDTAIQERLLFFGTFMLMGVFCYYATFRVLQHEGAGRRLTYVLAGASTVAYIFCPLNFYYVVDLFLLVGYALLPALLYTLLKFIWSERSGRDIALYGVLTGIIITASSGDPRWPVWNIFLVVLILFLMLAMDRFRGVLRGTGYLSVAVVSFVALSAFWILPTLFVPDQATLLARPNLSVNFYYVLNKYASLSNALVFQADFWTPARELFNLENGLLMSLYKMAQLVLPALALLSLLFFRKNRLVISLFIVSLIVLLLASAPLSPLQFIKDGYQYFVFNLPFGIAFRTSYKWLLLMAYPMVLLASYGILGFSRWLSTVNLTDLWRKLEPRTITRYVTAALVVLLVASSLIATWPMATGDFGGVISPKDLSSDYTRTYDLIEEQAGGDWNFKILYLPSNPHSGFKAPGLADSPYLHYLMTLLNKGNISKLGSALAPLGAKYIILDKTTYLDNRLENGLKNQSDLSVSFEGEQLMVLENERYSDQFRFSDLAMNFDSIDSGAARSAWDDWIQTDQAIMDLEGAFSSTPYVIMGPGYPYDLMVRSSETSSPFLYIPYYGDQSWQFITTYNPSNYDWINQLDSVGMENWNLDFGEGLAYVDANLTIPEDLPLPNSALVKNYDLTDRETVQEFVRSNYPEQFDAKQVLRWNGDSMRVMLLNATSGWKTVRSPLVEIDTNQTYTLTTEIRSQSGFDIHFKVAEYDENGSLMSVKPYYGLGSGEIDRTAVRLNYKTEDPEVRYISLQIWHGSNPTTPLPNTFWVDYVSIYNTTGLLRPPQLDGRISVDGEGQYRLYVRALNSPLGGNITVAIDGKAVGLGTSSDDTSLDWMYGGTLELTSGAHDVTILSNDGVNAVNMISLIKEDEYNALLSRYNAQLANKALIYVLHSNDPGNDHRSDLNASIGPADQYQVVKKEIEIFQPADYVAYASSENISTLYVDGNAAGTMDGNGRYLILHLDVGRHNVTILSEDPNYQADEILLFSANAGVNLAQLDSFYQASGKVVKVIEAGTSAYRLDVTSQGSSFLVFTHAFDSGWTVSSSDGSITQASSVPVNTAENGFVLQINGSADLVVSYSPDHLYNLGMAISLTSALVITISAVLFYIWGDRLRSLCPRLRRAR